LNKSKLFGSILNLFGNSKGAISVIFILFISFGFYYGKWRTEKIIQWDTIVYYEYLTAAFMFNDMSFGFIYSMPDDFDGEIWLETGPNGERFPKTTMGVAIMLTPTYLIAYFLNYVFDFGSYGYSSFFQFFIFLAGLFHFLAGIVILRKILRHYFSDKIATITLYAFSLASGILFYAVIEPGISHVYSFFLFTYLIWLTIKWHQKASWKNTILIGLVLGLIVLIRPTNIIMAIIPLLFGIENFKDWIQYFSKHIGKAIVAITIFAIVVFLQFAFWKYLTGNWLVMSYGDEGFFWTDPKLFEGLFGFRKGLFIYSPILLVACIGMFFGHGKLRKLKWSFIIFLALHTYIVFSWWCWWFGGGYGHRAFIDCLTIFAIFFAATLELLMLRAKQYQKALFILLIGFFVTLNQYQIKQYDRGHLHWDAMTWEAYKAIFFAENNPFNYERILDFPDYEEAKKGNGR